MNHKTRCRLHHVAACFALALSSACSRGALQITPATLTIGLDQAAPVRAVDAERLRPEGVAWKSADPNVAEIIEGDDGMYVRARAAGTTCISASTIWERAQTCVTVLPKPSLTPGTVRWSLHRANVRPSATIVDLVAASPADGGSVAMFMIEFDHGMGGHERSGLTVRGIDSDGREQWRRTFDGVSYETSFADRRGGLIIGLRRADGNPTAVHRLDGQDGSESWTYQPRGALYLRCPGCPTPHAVRGDDAIFIVDATDEWGTSASGCRVDLVCLDGFEGREILRLPLPVSKTVSREPRTWVPQISPMTLDAEQTLVLAAGAVVQDEASKTQRAQLSLLRVVIDGAAAWQTLREQDGGIGAPSYFHPRSVMAIGRGRLLVTWWEPGERVGRVVATRTGLSRWPVGVGVDLLNGPDGAAYGVTASGNLVRVDAASGAAEGVGIELGAGASIFPTAVPGAIVARNGRGQLLRYDPSRETIDALTDVSSEAPLQVRLIGGDAIFVEHSQILAIAVSSD